MDWQDRISVDPNVLVGKPVIKGARIAVEFLMELLASGWTHEQILKNYPHLVGFVALGRNRAACRLARERFHLLEETWIPPLSWGRRKMLGDPRIRQIGVAYGPCRDSPSDRSRADSMLGTGMFLKLVEADRAAGVHVFDALADSFENAGLFGNLAELLIRFTKT